MKKKALPPTYFMSSVAATIVLHFICPIHQLITGYIRLLGIPLLGIGLWLNLWADQLFKKHSTTVKPFEASSHLILEGPFKFTRNPMYLGMIVALLGEAVILGSVAAFVVPIAFYPVMNAVFIRREEDDMLAVFGDEFRGYMGKVRRWI